MKSRNLNLPARQPFSKSPSQKEVLSFVLAEMKGLVIQEADPSAKGVMKALDSMVKNWPLKPEQKKAIAGFFARMRFRPGFKPEQLSQSKVKDELRILLSSLEGVSTQATETMITSVRMVVAQSLKVEGKPAGGSVALRKRLKARLTDTDLDPQVKRMVTNLLYIIKPEKYLDQWPTADEVLSKLAKKKSEKEASAPKEKPVRPHDLVDKGNRYMLSREYLRAVKCFKLAIRIEKSGSIGRSALKEAYRRITEDESIVGYLNVENAYRMDGLLQAYMGNRMLIRDYFSRAREYYLKALKYDPSAKEVMSMALKNRRLIEKSKADKGEANHFDELDRLTKELLPEPLPTTPPTILKTPKTPRPASKEIPGSWLKPAGEATTSPAVQPAAMPPMDVLIEEAEAKRDILTGSVEEDVPAKSAVASKGMASSERFTDAELGEILVDIGWEVKPLDTLKPALGAENWGDEVEPAASELPADEPVHEIEEGRFDRPLGDHLPEGDEPIEIASKGDDDWSDVVIEDLGDDTVDDDPEGDFFGNYNPPLGVESLSEPALSRTDSDDSDTTAPLSSAMGETTEEFTEPLDSGIQAYISIGRNHVFNGKHQEATEAFQWVIKRSHQGEQVVFDLLRSIVQENSTNACAQLLLGKLYLHRKQDKKSIEHFGYAITLDPSLASETPMALKLMKPFFSVPDEMPVIHQWSTKEPDDYIDIDVGAAGFEETTAVHRVRGDQPQAIRPALSPAPQPQPVATNLQSPVLTSIRVGKEVGTMSRRELKELMTHLKKKLKSLKAANIKQGDITFVQKDFDSVQAYFEAKFEPKTTAPAEPETPLADIIESALIDPQLEKQWEDLCSVLCDYHGPDDPILSQAINLYAELQRLHPDYAFDHGKIANALREQFFYHSPRIDVINPEQIFDAHRRQISGFTNGRVSDPEGDKLHEAWAEFGFSYEELGGADFPKETRISYLTKAKQFYELALNQMRKSGKPIHSAAWNRANLEDRLEGVKALLRSLGAIKPSRRSRKKDKNKNKNQ